MTSNAKPERFALVLQAVPEPGDVPTIIRLRRFLKAVLRSYRLRCIRCEAIPEPGTAEEPSDQEIEKPGPFGGAKP